MKINKKLNFVIPIFDEAGKIVGHVHAEPIGEAVFDKYFEVIGQAFASIYGGGLGLLAGPRLAAKLIRKAAEAAGTWEGEDGVERVLFGEIRRLSSYVAPGAGGKWQPIPLVEAIENGTLSKEDASEVENALAFFTVASSMHKKAELPGILSVVSRFWDASTSSLNSTAFAASLGTSTEPASSGAKANPSSIPS